MMTARGRKRCNLLEVQAFENGTRFHSNGRTYPRDQQQQAGLELKSMRQQTQWFNLVNSITTAMSTKFILIDFVANQNSNRWKMGTMAWQSVRICSQQRIHYPTHRFSGECCRW